ncbi:MAG: SDR family oxidoreductase [Candidatus Marinimicrobia bacterium]|jgi:NAD(P)-dependent dehydrogenase (short-subunit alcohol dehydrogenase family)|nr:SDR family oxidoreductase [Candidatus Neomarinimicrobiota bacterium]MBT3633529.1 SDR family oxidoreductase [Candidatus Neomarinimicrobiota bacterium]MBT3681671.1 SDR family oxidoreductase [Candidatus Neomarinimicrobiota bacterium]MBT3758361.1 SDR family oxidoreductase [Candidatus Neomarinimicrobiota bacterium]MBT3894985.1 SDR family oxidoreductase [Candidatus Neomarinimicrobiota bacterium]
MKAFNNKSVLVTGGSRGIGKAIVKMFLNQGARVAFTYAKEDEAANKVISESPSSKCIAIKSDISDPAEAASAVNKTIENFNSLDILVNNAGIYLSHNITDVSYDDWQQAWEKTISVNLTGPANITYCGAKHMMKNGGGQIIQISSRGAFRGEPAHPAYGASKAGLNSFSQSLAQALAPYNIYIGIVAPGFVKTDMAAKYLKGDDGKKIIAQSPMNQVAEPDDIARAVLFLADENNKFTTGTIIDVNGASYLRS